MATVSYLCERIIQIAWTVLTTQVINSFTLSIKQMDVAGKLALQDLQQCANTPYAW